MAFENVTFPVTPTIHDYSRTVIDPVYTVTNGSYEYRIRRQRFEKFQWDVPTQTMSNEQKEEVRNFIASTGNGEKSFKFIDPAMSTLTDAVLRHSETTYWELMLPYSSTVPGNHPIFNPDVNSLSVTVDGSPGTITSFAISSTGIPVLNVAGTTGAEVVRVSGNIYFTVRLNSPFSETLIALDCNNSPTYHGVSSIQLLEVFGEY